MAASLGKRINIEKFKDPNWYTSLAVDLLDLKWGGVAKELSKALKPADETVAGQLTDIFVDSFNKSLIHLGEQGFIAKNRKEYTELFQAGVIDPEFPSHHPLYMVLLNEYKEFIGKRKSDALELVNLHVLRATFSSAFSSFTHHAVIRHPDTSNYLKNIRRNKPPEAKILEQVNEILFEVEQAPLAVDQRMTLLQNYVSPSCNLDIAHNIFEDPVPRDCLLRELVRLIETEVNPIVIHGQPGHGKTSSVKMLFRTICGLYAQVAAPPIPLLFEFKYLHALNRSAIDVLQERAKFIESDEFFFGRNTILILDGLDERQAADGGSDDFLKGFIRDLFDLARRVNTDKKSRLNLVLTGRSQYVGQVKSAFTGQYNLVAIQDFDEVKQKIWLKRFNRQTQKPLGYQQFHSYKLDEIVGQPILLAISSVVLSDNDGQNSLSTYSGEQVNRAIIYKTLIEWAYNKQWHKDSHLDSWKDDISLGEYFTLLQAIAFEMHRAGEETIRLSELSKALKENARQIFQLDCIGEKWLDNLEELLKRIRISFFFTGVEDKAFCFIHRSIKDFLIASGLVDASKSLFEDFSERKPERTDDELVALFGAKELSIEDHYGFLNEWLAFRQQELCYVVEPAYKLCRRVINQEFSLNGVRVVFEQNRKLAIVTHNFLYTFCSWFALVRKNNSDSTLVEFDDVLSHSERKNIAHLLSAHGLTAQFNYMWGQIEYSSDYHLFISHASEDKYEIAEPLFNALTERGLRVWFDKFEMKLGDKIATKINDGLRKSMFGVVILSPRFFQKEWPINELEALLAKESNQGIKLILPILHNMTHQELVGYSPTLAGRIASNTSIGINALVEQIISVLES